MSVVDHDLIAAEISVCAVIVTFHPDPAFLERLVSVVSSDAAAVLIIANDCTPPTFVLRSNVTVELPKTNLGLGAAYNQAARWAAERGASHLLLLDQDSLPQANMIHKLLKIFTKMTNAAAAGPLWQDSRTGRNGFFVQLSGRGRQKRIPAPDEIVPVDFLISSGSLIPLAALADIGPFDERLFIDHVDTDWSLRARAKGYRMYGVAGARIDQQFGEQTLTPKVAGLKGRLALYPPQRNYFLLRNSIILWRRPYATWRWIAYDIRRTFLFLLYYLLFVPPRWTRLKWMWRAVREGIQFG